MNDSITEQIQQGMQLQLQQWHNALQHGSQRFGWKVGFNRESDQQSAGLPSPQIGYLLAERSYPGEGKHHCVNGGSLLVEGEIAIQVAQPLTETSTPEEALNAIDGYSTGLELINTERATGNNITSLLSSNLVHEAVVIGGQPLTELELNGLDGSLTVNGKQVRALDSSRIPDNFGPLLCQVAKILASQGEELQAGDWIITGAATTPYPVVPGDQITFKIEGMSEVSLTIT